MSLSFRCLLSLSHLILTSALAQLPPGAQRGQAASASSTSNTSSVSSPSFPPPSSSSSQGSGPERSSFQWSPSGRRTGSLYCRVGIGFHLQIHPDGKVNGSHEANLLSILEIFAVSQGIVGIRGVFSNKFLAMSKKGKLHASNEEMARQLVELGFRGSGEVLKREEFEARKAAAEASRLSERTQQKTLSSAGKELKDNFLKALAEREEANRSGKMAGLSRPWELLQLQLSTGGAQSLHDLAPMIMKHTAECHEAQVTSHKSLVASCILTRR
uniref:Fibroblast growth factor n=1 Tax=Chrysemys picta bellii TaxID=8478 RepID=A0A8C3FP86_CHRPI